MTTTEANKQPTHRIYAVRKGANDKSFWTAIGAAWANQDGKGFTIKLYLLPIDGADIVMREPKEEGDAK